MKQTKMFINQKLSSIASFQLTPSDHFDTVISHLDTFPERRRMIAELKF